MGHSDQYLQKVETVARHGLDQIAEGVETVRTQVSRAADRTVGYVQEAPVRSALVAIAVGTLVFAVARMLSTRSASSSRSMSPRSMSPRSMSRYPR